MTAGRVWRADDPEQFGASSGLSGRDSDWLGAVQLASADGLLMTGRVLFDDDYSTTKTEVRLDLTRKRYSVAGSYLYVIADPVEDRLDATSELTMNGRVKLNPNWTGRLSGRYDFIADQGTRAAAGLAFRNECLLVDLSLSRRFTSSTTVTPSTSFELAVDLLGFGGKAAAGPARTCRR